MLGRQQIAGIPTAISELFKNAHDAYARNAEVDYFRDDGLFVLRDDGLGMTREDFERRWLTLGTESKIGSAALKPPPRDPDQPERPILGEKGIGRLAIAIIGPQVLVLSRAKINGKPSNKTIAAYLHWGLFELPGLNLEDITIPVREFRGGTLPSGDDVKEMVDEVASTLDRLAPLSDRRRIRKIRTEMGKFDADPLEYAEYLDGPSLRGSGCGTHFHILPADPIIEDDIDNRQASNKATRFEKSLIGFTNTMTPDHERPPIICRLRDHKDEDLPQELISERTFFTPDEFEKVDHHFLGHFDEYGQFPRPSRHLPDETGTLRSQLGRLERPADRVRSVQTVVRIYAGCCARLSGSPKEHPRLRRKLDRYGGLYIYRDGIRVQPYGDSDYDWLDIERNRTLGMTYYFYSYRRMFGVIELSRTKNGKLTEKAGREGFRENRAYRQFRSILMNFFRQTAGDFFREEGKYSDVHIEKREELNRKEEIRRKKAKQVRQRRTALQNALQKVFVAIDERKPELEAEECLSVVKRDATKVLARDISKQRKALALMQSEQGARERLHDLRANLTVIRPRGIGLSRNLLNEWYSYSTHMERLDSEVFGPTEAKIETYISDVARKTRVPLDDISRLNSVVSEHGDEALKTVRRLRSDVDALTKNIAATVKEEARNSFRAVRYTVDDVMAELERLQSATKRTDSLPKIREKFVRQIISVYESEREKLERLRDQLNQVNKFWEQDGYDSAELTEALEEELDELKTQRDADLELAQIGMALNTISHEFDKTVGSLRNGLRKLKAWSDANPSLRGLYRNIRISFDHLDEYLTLFTPLDRRLNRTRIIITGKQIYDFLSKLFQARLKRHEVILRTTKAFSNASISCYPSSLYPPFVNLVDNAIFWLQRNRDRPRRIILDADGDDLLVRDNGPGVSARDSENIFAMNFSRRPGGRGMGLPISRETLSQIDLRLTLDPAAGSEGAVFRISPDGGKGTAEEAE